MILIICIGIAILAFASSCSDSSRDLSLPPTPFGPPAWQQTIDPLDSPVAVPDCPNGQRLDDLEVYDAHQRSLSRSEERTPSFDNGLAGDAGLDPTVATTYRRGDIAVVRWDGKRLTNVGDVSVVAATFCE